MITSTTDQPLWTGYTQFYSSVEQLLLLQESNNDLILKIIDQLNLSALTIQEINLRSGNLELDDLRTVDMPLLLAHYYIAQAYTRLQTPTNPFIPTHRLDLLNKSLHHYQSFISVQGQFLPVPEPIPKSDDTRSLKIQRYKTILMHQHKVLDLVTILGGQGTTNVYVPESYLSVLKQTLDIPTYEPTLQPQTDQDQQENLVRSLITHFFEYCLESTQTELEAIRSETQILNRRGVKQSVDSSAQLDYKKESDALLDKSGRPLRPFVLTATQLQAQVFRPGHALPTMSLDEYISADLKQGGILPPTQPKLSDSNCSDDDESLYKKRAWDAFKDDNPKGWGNRNTNRG